MLRSARFSTPVGEPGCPISAFGGLHDHRVSRGDLEAWRDQTSASFSVRMFPGDHFFLNTIQPILLPLLSQELSEAG
jgi:medium-chain acyl-[acyl-carrier-protein] hydrolase